MRILVTYRINQYSQKMAGVWQKLLGQLEGFEQCGFDVYTLYMSYGCQVLARFNEGNLIRVNEWKPILIEHEKEQFWANAIEACELTYPDIIYTRYDKMYDHSYLTQFVKSPPVQLAVVCMEFATFPYADEILCENKRLQDDLNRESLAPYVNLVFSTSDYKQILGLPNHHFANQLSQTYLENASRSDRPLIGDDGVIHLISVGNISYWHGYDRLINGIAEYKNNDGSALIQCHIIGEGDEISALKSLVESHSLNDVVVFHGYQSGLGLQKIYQFASAGIAGLGIHRKGLQSSSTLKVREYLANGLPVIYSSFDPVLKELSCSMEINGDESYLNIERVIGFILHCEKDKNIRKNIREYAMSVLGWSKFAYLVKREVEKLNFDCTGLK